MKYYLVGGAIRDRLLGIPVKDRDYLVTGATAKTMLAAGFRQVGADFPVFIHPETGDEYALARTERKSGSGYHGFVVDNSAEISLEADLQRRDLTINAIAEDIDNKQLLDPFGGVKDIQQRLLRHVSPAFIEDPLRVLRVARFTAQLDFSVAPETMSLMQKLSASGELRQLRPERVWIETEKALATDMPHRYIETLRECGALAEIFPEIDALFGIPQNAKYHPEIDSGIHTILALKQASQLSTETCVRFAVLVHDLGKALTPREELPAHRNHDIRGVPVIQKLCQRLRTPKKYRQLAELVSRYHIDCHRIMEMKPGSVLHRLEALDAFRRPKRFEQFLLCCRADAQGRLGKENEPYPPADYFFTAFSHCQRTGIQAIVKAGLDGDKIATAIRTERLKNLRLLKKTFSVVSNNI